MRRRIRLSDSMLAEEVGQARALAAVYPPSHRRATAASPLSRRRVDRHVFSASLPRHRRVAAASPPRDRRATAVRPLQVGKLAQLAAAALLHTLDEVQLHQV